MPLRLLLALLTGLLILSQSVPVAAAADARRVLVVPYRTQLDGNPYDESDCGPATMGMVLAAYGRDVPTAEIRGLVNDLQGTWRVYDAGTFIENLDAIASRYGLRPYGLFDPAQPRKAPGKNKLRRWTLDQLRQSLDAGHPVVPQVWYRGLPGREKRPYNGDHYIVVIGYDGDDFIYNDPIDKDGPGAGRRISSAQLDRAWKNGDYPYAAVAIAGPPSRPATAAVAEPPRVQVPIPTATPRPNMLRPASLPRGARLLENPVGGLSLPV